VLDDERLKNSPVKGSAIPDKKRTDARSKLCFWAKEGLDMTQRELALALDVTPPAINYAIKRGRMIVEKNSYSIKSK
jgi:hypothetical protein